MNGKSRRWGWLWTLALALGLLALLCVPARAATGVLINASNFPDATFRAFVREGYDVNDDGVLSQAEIAAATTMDCHDMGISSLRGIEYFTALSYLNCSSNNLSSLDLSNNTNLQYLYCFRNNLTWLNLYNTSRLEFLSCSNNQLYSLNISGNTKLDTLLCHANRFTTLDVSKAPKLVTAVRNGTKVETYDLGGPNYFVYSYEPNSYTTYRLAVNTDVNLVTTAFYDVWVQGRQVTSDNMDDVWGNGAVSYTPAAGGAPAKLTLNNAAIAGAAGHGSYTQDKFGIEVWGSLELALTGENTVISGNATRHSAGIYCTGKLTVSGSGKLTAISGTAGSGYSSGIRANGDFTVNGGQITASGGEVNADNVSDGICTTGDMVINGGTVYMGGAVTGAGYGAYASGSIIIKGGTVTASGGRRAFAKNPDLSGYANADVLVNNAVSSSGRRPWNGTDPLGGSGSSFKYVYIEPATYYNVWVQGRRVTYRNQIDVLGDGGSVVFDHTESTLTLTDAHITGAAGHGAHTEDNYGIESRIPLELVLVGENSVSSVDSQNHSFAVACYDNLTISGSGGLSTSSGVAENGLSYGIYVHGSFIINSGQISSRSNQARYTSAGIYATQPLVINGGTVCADGTAANAQGYGGYGFEPLRGITINGGEITALGSTRAYKDNDIDLSDYPNAVITVNTSPTATGATEWNGAADLGGSGSPFKYVSILPYGTIRNVAVSGFVTPVAGQTAISGYDLTVPEGAPYSVNRISWHDAETWQYIRPPFQFEAGRSYYAVIVLYASNGYVFPGVGTTGYGQFDSFTLNGGTALISAPDTQVVSNRECYMITVDLEAASLTILVGDVNGDGSVTSLDALLLSRYLAGWTVSIDTDAADLNRDGSVTSLDALLLRRFLAGWTGYESYIIEVPVTH